MGATSQEVGAILSEIHGLMHEAKSNVEIDVGKAQKMIARLAAAETAQRAGTFSSAELQAIVEDVGTSIEASIQKEMSIDNPEAAVIQIRGLLDQLAQML